MTRDIGEASVPEIRKNCKKYIQGNTTFEKNHFIMHSHLNYYLLLCVGEDSEKFFRQMVTIEKIGNNSTILVLHLL